MDLEKPRTQKTDPYGQGKAADLKNRSALPSCHPEPIRCHSERSEESRSEHFQGSARLFVAAAPQNDSAKVFPQPIQPRPSKIVVSPDGLGKAADLKNRSALLF